MRADRPGPLATQPDRAGAGTRGGSVRDADGAHGRCAGAVGWLDRVAVRGDPSGRAPVRPRRRRHEGRACGARRGARRVRPVRRAAGGGPGAGGRGGRGAEHRGRRHVVAGARARGLALRLRNQRRGRDPAGTRRRPAGRDDLGGGEAGHHPAGAGPRDRGPRVGAGRRRQPAPLRGGGDGAAPQGRSSAADDAGRHPGTRGAWPAGRHCGARSARVGRAAASAPRRRAAPYDQAHGHADGAQDVRAFERDPAVRRCGLRLPRPAGPG